MRRLFALFSLAALSANPITLIAQAPPVWGMYNGNAQHTGISTVPMSEQAVIKWSTPVDLNPQYSGNDLLIHYGSPLATAANTIVVPVKTGTTDTFKVEGRQGYAGTLMWTQTSDYTLPPHAWTPSYSPAITPQNRLYFPGEGGTIFYRDSLDTFGNATPTRLSFYGLTNYQNSATAARNNVFVNTPITSDASGNIFFGVQVTNTVTLGSGPGSVTLQSGGGIVRISNTGVGTYMPASTAAADAAMNKVVHSSAPALSNDGSTVYVAVSSGTGNEFGPGGYLVALNSTTLAPTSRVALKDPNSPANNARLPESGSASPMVAPNGDVFMGVLENTNQYHSRGWMLHFNSTLSQTLIPSRFGWDNTASIIDSSLVPSYSGNSPYLILTKYNNYVSTGGDGKNKLGIFDPFVSETDQDFYNIAKGNPTNLQVAKKILEVLGPTPDGDYPNNPGAVREWCINSAAVDPFNKAVIVNSEDGKSYCWDLVTNTLTDAITLTPGVGEAYTPTIIGPDGTGYAINNGILFAMGPTAVPEPGTLVLGSFAVLGAGMYIWHRRRKLQRAWQE